MLWPNFPNFPWARTAFVEPASSIALKGRKNTQRLRKLDPIPNKWHTAENHTSAKAPPQSSKDAICSQRKTKPTRSQEITILLLLIMTFWKECGGLAKWTSGLDHEIMLFISTSLAPWLPITRAFQTSRPPPPPEKPSRKQLPASTLKLRWTVPKKNIYLLQQEASRSFAPPSQWEHEETISVSKTYVHQPLPPSKRSFQFPPLASNSTASAAESTGAYAKRAGLNRFGLVEWTPLSLQLTVSLLAGLTWEAGTNALQFSI